MVESSWRALSKVPEVVFLIYYVVNLRCVKQNEEICVPPIFVMTCGAEPRRSVARRRGCARGVHVSNVFVLREQE